MHHLQGLLLDPQPALFLSSVFLLSYAEITCHFHLIPARAFSFYPFYLLLFAFICFDLLILSLFLAHFLF